MLYKPNNTKQKQNNNNSPISPFENYTDNPELRQRLKDFLEMRKAIKKPMTDRAKKELLAKLDKLASTDEEKIAILDQSIFNSWQGVFALKRDNLPKPQPKPRQPSETESVHAIIGGGYETFNPDRY